jgi:hypothetical protein
VNGMAAAKDKNKAIFIHARVTLTRLTSADTVAAAATNVAILVTDLRGNR